MKMGTPSGIKPERTGFPGLVDSILAKHLGRLLAIPGRKRYRAFEKATLDTAGAQQRVLRELLQYAADTVFGREHSFNEIRSYEDYKARVPILDYEDHRPYIARHQKGEPDVLFPGKPLMYNCSSGTTSEPKLLPVTKFNFERSIKDRSKLWLYSVMRHFPGVYDGKCVSVVSTHQDGTTEDGTPFGAVSGLIRKNLPPFINLTHTAPYDAMLISDHTAKTYTLCRFSLAEEHVTLIITGNPATVLNLAVKADAWKEDIIRDIRDGTLKADLKIEPHIRAALEARLDPAPQRALALEALVRQHGQLRPRDYWPDMKLLHMWTNGNTGLMVPKLWDWYHKDTPTLDFGYVSSEILSTDVMIPGHGGSVLAIENGFYEFMPMDDMDKDDADKRFFMAHQLEKGGRYFIYVSTFSGLYRYDINDVIEVVDFFNTAPVIKFLFKGKGMTNMLGEKLSEAQFIEAVGLAAKRTNTKHDFFIGYADMSAFRYKLYIEFLETHTEAEKEEFARNVDDALCEVNIEYDAKRKTERLHGLEIVDMGKDFFSRFRDLRLDEGALEGQIKWLQLSAGEADKNRLENLRVK